MRMWPSKNDPFGIDLKPFSPSKGMIFPPGVHTLALAAFADRGAPLFEVHSSVINRRNDNFTSAIRETVLSVSDDPDKPVVEPVSPVVHHRDTTYYDLAPAVNVDPACFWRVHSG